MPCPPHSLWLKISVDEYILWCSSLCNFLHSPVTSSIFSEPCSQTRSVYALPSVRDQVSYPYKTTGRIMVLYILTFIFLDSRQDDKTLWTEW
jgi:hypothetical protein